jgi:hypothetical protein
VSDEREIPRDIEREGGKGEGDAYNDTVTLSNIDYGMLDLPLWFRKGSCIRQDVCRLGNTNASSHTSEVDCMGHSQGTIHIKYDTFDSRRASSISMDIGSV